MHNERLKLLREDRELKQKDIVQILDCKRSTYANWENETIILPLEVADKFPQSFYKNIHRLVLKKK